ncbi:MAG: peptidylprolyl isomerase [Flavobacteriales bacterium]|nr:peptidylprolyl isomerase [Flavobacteriales bacterium]
MNRKLALILGFLCAVVTVQAQNESDVLLTIDGDPVYASEFKRVYTKNLELVQDESQKNVTGYLDLFIDYKLKVAEAYAQNLDEAPSYQKEFAKYEEQLSRNYIFEDKVTEELTKEAYERGLEEIEASHILIRADYNSVPQDTLKAYNKIAEIRERAIAGEDFASLAKELSEEPGAKERAGYLGYFSVFSLVYPFESMAYATPEGEISEIVRTQYGYHIIYVQDRRERSPKIEVSHIMISENKGPRTFDPEERINEINTLLAQGESFESLAKQFSDDTNSAKRGGKLNPFGKGELRSKIFEEKALELSKPGELSKPFKSEFGWHIVRFDGQLPIETFEEKQPELEKRVKEGSRSKIIVNAVNKVIKDRYGFENGEPYLPFFENYVTDSILKRKWEYVPISSKEDKLLFKIGDNKVTYNDFASFVNENQKRRRLPATKRAILIQLYDEFETRELKQYFRKRLEYENEEYAGVIGEYRDGLLIFDVMNKNIWKTAKNDSIGLREFFQKTNANYVWKQRVDASILTATDKTTAALVQAMLQQGKAAEEVKEELNTNDSLNVILTTGIFEIDEKDLPPNLEVAEGVSKIYPNEDTFVVVKVKKIFPPGNKSLEDVKGRVINAYQTYLEEQWMESLRKKYKVEVNKKVLKKLQKELDS